MKRSSVVALSLALGSLTGCTAQAPWDGNSPPIPGSTAGDGTVSNPGSGNGSGASGNLGGDGLSMGGTGTGASSGTGTGSGADGGSVGYGGPAPTESSLRKVKNVLTGLAATDAELATSKTPGGLKTLITTWLGTPEFQDKLVFFFENTFQQSQVAQLDFEFQLRKRPGAFDLAYSIFGDNAYPKIYQNMKESFARTAVQFFSTGRSMSDLLTTNEFMMTTALKSLYMQIEAPYDIHTMNWKFNHGKRPPLSETLDPTSPNYMTFGYEAPTKSTGKMFGGTCAGDTSKISTCPGNTLLFRC